jgi:putative ABC transport system permease protein
MTRLGDACYRLVLLAFPPSFRRRHGPAMLEQFRAQRRAVQGRPMAIASLWLRALVDGLRHGIACRIETPRVNGGDTVRTIRQDLRHTWRVIRSRPGATAATVMVLGLGIGLTSAIFALADPFMLRPLPYADPGQLAVIGLESENRRPGPFPTLLDIQSRTDLFTGAAAYTPLDIQRLRLRLAESDVMLPTAAVSRTFFSVLGVPIRLPADWDSARARGETPLVLLPDADVRLRRLPAGTALRTQEGAVIRIVGWLPQGFVFPRDRVSPVLAAIVPMADDWLLNVRISSSGGGTSYSATSRTVIARLVDGVSPGLVQSVLGPPESTERAYSLKVESLRTQMTARLRMLAVGAFTAGLLIAVGCAANVAILLLARGTSRAAEFATRKALGASRLDLARLVLIELVVLSVLGVAAGLGCAALALGVAGAVIPAEFVALGTPAVTGRVAGFAMAVGVLITIVGVLPAMALWRLAPPSSIAPGAHRESRGVRLWRFGMTAAQSAVAMILLAGAVLLGRSFLLLNGQNTGFSGDPVVVSVSYPTGHTREPLQRDIDVTIDRLRQIPGVSAAAAATGAMVDGSMAGMGLTVDGKATLVQTKRITPGYFEAVGTPIVAGRTLDDRDRPVRGLIVNERAAAALWPEGAAVGRSVPWDKSTVPVVGVVADTFDQALDVRPGPMLFTLLHAPASGARVNFVVRTTESVDAIRRIAERAVVEVNRDAIVTDVSGVGDRLAASVRDRVFAALVATMFAAAGVGVCAFGLVGVVSSSVARRTREIAIRSAIGAEPRHVRRLVMRQALTAALAGTVVGLTAGWWSSRWLDSLLYGIEAGDAPTLLGGAALMLAVVAAATWFPARRALRLSPTLALKTE